MSNKLDQNRELYDLAVATLDALPKDPARRVGLQVTVDTVAELEVQLGGAVFRGVHTRVIDGAAYERFQKGLERSIKAGTCDWSGMVKGSGLRFYVDSPSHAPVDSPH